MLQIAGGIILAILILAYLPFIIVAIIAAVIGGGAGALLTTLLIAMHVTPDTATVWGIITAVVLFAYAFKSMAKEFTN